MNKAAKFRQLKNCKGTFLSSGSVVVTEIAALYPFDWLLLDMEHGGLSADAVMDHLRVCSGKQAATIVRVPGIDPVLISKVLDAGADGIMVPHVLSADDVRACVKAMYYLPKGNRGFSSSTRQFAFGLDMPADISEANKPLLFAQIEDVEAVVNVNEIAAMEEVDVLFVGPADLKLALKHNAQTEIDFDKSLKLVAEAAQNHSKKAGILAREESLLRRVNELGYSCVAMDSDIAIIKSGFKTVIEKLKT